MHVDPAIEGAARRGRARRSPRGGREHEDVERTRTIHPFSLTLACPPIDHFRRRSFRPAATVRSAGARGSYRPRRSNVLREIDGDEREIGANRLAGEMPIPEALSDVSRARLKSCLASLVTEGQGLTAWQFSTPWKSVCSRDTRSPSSCHVRHIGSPPTWCTCSPNRSSRRACRPLRSPSSRRQRWR